MEFLAPSFIALSDMLVPDHPNRELKLVQAKALLAAGRFQEALLTCTDLISENPNDEDASWILALAHLRLGHSLVALRITKQFLRHNPLSIRLQTLQTDCFLDSGCFVLAKQSAELACMLSDSEPGTMLKLAEVCRLIEEREVVTEMMGWPVLQPFERVGLNSDFASYYHSLPIIINSRDRLTDLKKLVKWCQRAGYKHIVVIDNLSTYRPLVEYFESQELHVFRLHRNLGHRALWRSGLAEKLCTDVPYIYTDPDVLPIEECPNDVALHLWSLLLKCKGISKAGLGIKIDDLPDTYEHKNDVLAWESQFRGRHLRDGCYLAPVDTTFALYRPGSLYHVRALRTDFPYLIRHLPWYQDSSHPTFEDSYYARNADPKSTSWSGLRIRARYKTRS